jgi:hypothetical protein
MIIIICHLLQGIYKCIPKTHHVSRLRNVTAVQLLQYLVYLFIIIIIVLPCYLLLCIHLAYGYDSVLKHLKLHILVARRHYLDVLFLTNVLMAPNIPLLLFWKRLSTRSAL